MQIDAPFRVTVLSRIRSVTRRWTGCSIRITVFYLGFCASLAVAGFLRPWPTYDRFFYAGAIASLRYSDPVTIHRIARAEYDKQPFPLRSESAVNEPYFADMHDNPYHFMQQLGFYRVKPAYIAIGYALWRAGLPILVGLRLITAFCMFVLGLVVLVWTHDAILSAILLLTPPVISMGRAVTVDPLSTLIVILALFAFAKKKEVSAISLLMASIFVRFDNVILVLILLAWLVWKQRVRFPIGTMLGVIAVISTVLINRLTGYYGWRVLMQHSFIKPEIEPVNHPVLINLAGYLHALFALRVIPYTFMTIWLLVAVAVWKRLPSESVFRDLLPLAGIAILVRLAIFPDLEDRYYVWAYLLAGVALIRTSQTGAWLDD